jgi:hypothetical protein
MVLPPTSTSTNHEHVIELSVPSSSGISLQHAARAEQTDIFQRSFSSLLVGNLSATALISLVSVYAFSTFSSLLVGNLSATCRGHTAPPGYCIFQFPPRRESLCNYAPGQILWINSNHLSVPSSSGISLQPSSWITVKNIDFLSVPSSSGISLQLSDPHWAPIRICPFSSLLVGNLSATKALALLREFLDTFSSLLVGNLSATLWPFSSCRQNIFLSVPSSSGISLQRKPLTAPSDRINFQFPPRRESLCNRFQNPEKIKVLHPQPASFFESSYSALNTRRFAKSLYKTSPQ